MENTKTEFEQKARNQIDQTTNLAIYRTKVSKPETLPNGDYKHQRPANSEWFANEFYEPVQEKFPYEVWTLDSESIIRKALKDAYGIELSPIAFNRSVDAVKTLEAKSDNKSEYSLNDYIKALKSTLKQNSKEHEDDEKNHLYTISEVIASIDRTTPQKFREDVKKAVITNYKPKTEKPVFSFD